jgi:hypothetical protein
VRGGSFNRIELGNISKFSLRLSTPISGGGVRAFMCNAKIRLGLATTTGSFPAMANVLSVTHFRSLRSAVQQFLSH